MNYSIARINDNFFDENLKKHISSNKIIKKIKNIIKEEEFIEIYSFQFSGNKEYTYTEFLFFEIDNKYIPILIENINTSSPYAYEKGYFTLDNNENEDNDEIYKNYKIEINDLCENLYEGYYKNNVKELLLELSKK